jgi:geranylgeranyl pyrophosphate synthase
MDYKTKAIELLSEFPENEAKRSLKDLVEYVVTRSK